MAEISDLLHKKVSQKFPVMNVIIGEDGKDYRGTTQVREIGGHNVTVVIGTSNVHIIKAELIEEDDETG